MEFLCKSLVLLFVILYRINTTAGQGFDLTLYRRCQGIILEQQCTNGLAQEIADLAYRCNQPQTAEVIHVGCQQNPSGLYCGLAVALYTIEERLSNIESVCATSDTSCTDQCRTLLTNIRNDLGCCISVTFNDSSSLFVNDQAFRYSLWSSCGIEPVANDCTSSSVTLTRMPVDPNCDPVSYSQQIGQLYCTQRYIEPLLNALSAEQGCQLYRASALETCGVNEFGRACYEEPSLASGFSTALINCRNTATCNPGCTSALRNFKESAGCCINNFYNGSSSVLSGISYDWLSNNFWSMCGLETPGFCEASFNGATAHTALHAPVILLIAVIAYF